LRLAGYSRRPTSAKTFIVPEMSGLWGKIGKLKRLLKK